METHYKDTARELADQLRDAMLDHEAFDRLLEPCSLERCRATCCYDGVYLSDEEARGLKELTRKNRGRFIRYGLELPEEVVIAARGGGARKTAIREADAVELADDYPAHFAKTRCVFLDKLGRCGIQRMNIENYQHPWRDKPLTCWIHPIVILPPNRERSRSLVTLVSSQNDPQKRPGYAGFASCTHCGRSEKEGSPASEVLEAELKAIGELAGRNFLAELNAPRIDY